MKTAERDALVERTAIATERLAAATERAERREQEERARRRLEEGPPPPRDPDKKYDALGRQIPQPIRFTGFVAAIPGLAAQFKPIPDSHYDRRERTVSCPCGTTTRLERQLHSCDGKCGRYFAGDGGGAFSAGPYADDDDETAAA